MADDYVEVSVTPEQYKAISSEISQSPASSQPVAQPVSQPAVATQDYLPPAPKPATGIGFLQGVGNVLGALGHGANQAIIGVGNTVQNPGPLLGQVSNAVQTDTQHQNPLMDFVIPGGETTLGAGAGAVQGTAQMVNGVLGIPAAYDNAANQRKPGDAGYQEAAIQIPTGGLDKYIAQNHPVSGMLGTLAPLAATEVLTAGSATPEILAARGVLKAAQEGGEAEKIAQATQALKALEAAKKATLLERLTTKNPLRPANIGEKLVGGLGRSAGVGVEYGLLGTPGSVEDRGAASLNNAALGSVMHLGGSVLGNIHSGDNTFDTLRSLSEDNSNPPGGGAPPNPSSSANATEPVKDPVTGMLTMPAQTQLPEAPPAGPGVLTGKVEYQTEAPENTSKAPWDDDSDDDDGGGAPTPRSPENGQPVAPAGQAAEGQPINITDQLEAIRQRQAQEQAQAAAEQEQKRQALMQRIQQQGQQMDANQPSANPASETVEGAKSAADILRARQQELLRQQQDQVIQQKADELHARLTNYERVGAKSQANKLKAELAEQAASHPDPIQRAAYQRALNKYAPVDEPTEQPVPTPDQPIEQPTVKLSGTASKEGTTNEPQGEISNPQGKASQSEGQQPTQGTPQAQESGGQEQNQPSGEEALKGVVRKAYDNYLNDVDYSKTNLSQDFLEKINPDTGKQYQAHGMSGTIQDVKNLLDKGIDPKREFFTGELTKTPGETQYGIGVRDNSPFVLVGEKGQPIDSTHPPKYLVVDDNHAPFKAEIQKEMPSVKVMDKREAVKFFNEGGQETLTGKVSKYVPEVQAELDRLDAEHNAYREREMDRSSRSSGYQEQASKNIKGHAMETAARKREAIQGDSLEPVEGGLTGKELQARIDRENSNYNGKPVTVKGKPGKVLKTAFGRVQVEFNDGERAYFQPDEVQAVARPAAKSTLAEQPTPVEPTVMTKTTRKPSKAKTTLGDVIGEALSGDYEGFDEPKAYDTLESLGYELKQISKEKNTLSHGKQFSVKISGRVRRFGEGETLGGFLGNNEISADTLGRGVNIRGKSFNVDRLLDTLPDTPAKLRYLEEQGSPQSKQFEQEEAHRYEAAQKAYDLIHSSATVDELVSRYNQIFSEQLPLGDWEDIATEFDAKAEELENALSNDTGRQGSQGKGEGEGSKDDGAAEGQVPGSVQAEPEQEHSGTVTGENKKKIDASTEEALNAIYPEKPHPIEGILDKTKPQGTNAREHLLEAQAHKAAKFLSPAELEAKEGFSDAYNKLSPDEQEKLHTLVDAITTKKKVKTGFYNPGTETAAGVLTKRSAHGQELYTPKGLSLTKNGDILVHGYNENAEMSSRRLDRFSGKVEKTTEEGYQGLYKHPSDLNDSETFHPADAIVEQVANPILKKQVLGKPIVDSDYRQAARTLTALVQELHPEYQTLDTVKGILNKLPDPVKEWIKDPKGPCH